MTTLTVCVPVTEDGQVEQRFGRAPAVAIAQVADGAITDWRVEDVAWGALHDAGPEGAHHARIVRFLRDNGIQVVVADHMGEPMQRTVAKLGLPVRLGAAGDARAAVVAAVGDDA